MPKPAQSMAESVLQSLKRQIMFGELPSGSMLLEQQIAARFGISKTPAREAMLRLAEMGFVVVHPGKGYQVTEVSWRDIRDLFELRLILESAAAELAAGRIQPEEIAMLRAVAERPRGADRTTSELYEYNTEFHLGLAAAAHNQRLLRNLTEVLEHLQRVMHEDWRSVLQDEMVDRHLYMVDLVAAGNAAGARQAVAEHVEATRRRLLGL